MRKLRARPPRSLGFEKLESRSLLSASAFYFSTGYAAGDGGLVAPGTGSIFAAGTSGTPIGAEFGDVDAGGFGAAEGFGSGFGVPGASAGAGPGGFGNVGSGGFGTAGDFPGGVGGSAMLGAQANAGSIMVMESASGDGSPTSGGMLGETDSAGGAIAGSDSGPSAAGGVGQMTLTTGDNTLGIRSFATPIAGFGDGISGVGSRVTGGGTGSDETESAPEGDSTTPDAAAVPTPDGVAPTIIFNGLDASPGLDGRPARASSDEPVLIEP